MSMTVFHPVNSVLSHVVSYDVESVFGGKFSCKRTFLSPGNGL